MQETHIKETARTIQERIWKLGQDVELKNIIKMLKCAGFLCLLLLSLTSGSLSAPSVEAENYTIDGDVVYVDDANCRIAVYPHTLQDSGFVYLNVTSKVFSGGVDFLFGFDSEVAKPMSLDKYAPHNVTYEENLTEYFENASLYKVDRNFTLYIAPVAYDGYVWVSENVSWLDDENNTFWSWNPIYEHRFDWANLDTKMIYWNVSRLWKNVKDKVDIDVIRKEVWKMDRWYKGSGNVTAGTEYHLRFYLHIMPKLEPQSGKYWCAFKPSDESFSEAIDNGHFYTLDPWWNTQWDYRMKLTFNNTASTENFTDFPVMVWLNSSHTSFWSHVNTSTDYADVRFLDADESNELYFEVESWNDTANSTYMWVKVPHLENTSEDCIWLYYGNSLATVSFYNSAEDVWNSDYQLVWHLNGAPGGTPPQAIDSTSNNNDGTTAGMSAGDLIDAKIDGGYDFDGADDFVSVGYTAPQGNSQRTIETWVYPRAEEAKFFFGYGTSSNGRAYSFSVESFGGDTCVMFRFWGGRYCFPNATLNQWNYVVTVVPVGASMASDVKVYIDGVEKTGTLAGGSDQVLDTSGSTFFVAKDFQAGTHANMQGDEPRILDVAMSASWIYAQWLSTNNTFITYGAEQSLISTFAPDYSEMGINQTYAGNSTYFYCDVNSSNGLSGSILNTNNSGVSINQSWRAISGTTFRANDTLTLNDTVGVVIAFFFFVNDTFNNFLITEIFTFATDENASGADIIFPELVNFEINNTYAGNATFINVRWNVSEGTLSRTVMETNNSGSPVNGSWIVLSGSTSLANETLSLNDTVGVAVYFTWYANDSDNEWATETQVLIVTNENASGDVGPPSGAVQIPFLSVFVVNNSLAGNITLITVTWVHPNASLSLSHTIMETNNSGTPTNLTWYALSGTTDSANETVTLNAVVGEYVYFKWYANDSDGNWATETQVVTLTQVGGGTDYFVLWVATLIIGLAFLIGVPLGLRGRRDEEEEEEMW